MGPAYLKRFDYATGCAFSAPFSEEMGTWIRENTRPDETLAVRAMEP